MFAKVRLNANPMATPSICLQYLLLNVKNDSLLGMFSKLQKAFLRILEAYSLSSHKL